MATPTPKKLKWVRTDLHPDHFKEFSFGGGNDTPQGVKAPRVVKVYEDGKGGLHKASYRLKRYVDDPTTEIAIAEELNRMGIRAPRPKLAESDNPRFPGYSQKRMFQLLYPEIKGKQLRELIEEGIRKGDISFTRFLRQIGEEDARIAKRALDEKDLRLGRFDSLVLASFENRDDHIYIDENDNVSRIDVAPFMPARFRMGEAKTYADVLNGFTQGFFEMTQHVIRMAEGDESTKRRAMTDITENYFEGVKNHLGSGVADEVKKRIIEMLERDKL